MSYLSYYMEYLDFELEDYFDKDDDILTYDLFLKSAIDYSNDKDEKADKYYSKYAFQKNTDINAPIFQLNRANILKHRASLMQNFTNSFARIIKDENRIMCFTTVTIAPKYRLANYQDSYKRTILNQHNLFTKFYTHIRHDKSNRNVKYFRVFELHKKGDIHSHSMDFIKDNLLNICNHINVMKRAKKSKDIGRIEIRLPYKYKNQIINIYSLKRHGDRYYENLKEYKSGNSLIFTFFQPNKDNFKDIVSYILKYTQKNVAYTKSKSNEYYIFRKLGIRSFVYSLKVLPSLVAYQKVRTELIKRNNKYKDLYELQKDIDKGLVSFYTTYEIKDPIYRTKISERVEKVDYSQECPIIYTFLSKKDICVSKRECKLIAVTVSFSDFSPAIIWQTGQYSTIELPEAA